MVTVWIALQVLAKLVVRLVFVLAERVEGFKSCFPAHLDLKVVCDMHPYRAGTR
jgi:hypothetical protein